MKNVKNFNEFINEGYKLSKKYDINKRKYIKTDDKEENIEIENFFNNELSNIIVKKYKEPNHKTK
jgi:hypothetical protein